MSSRIKTEATYECDGCSKIEKTNTLMLPPGWKPCDFRINGGVSSLEMHICEDCYNHIWKEEKTMPKLWQKAWGLLE